MYKSIELPISEPIYSTYHLQGTGGAVIKENPSIRNWYLNNSIILECNRKFILGCTTPEVNVLNSLAIDNPCLEFKKFPVKYLCGSINTVIRNLIDDGYFVYYSYADDYYIEGKSWYHERHFAHDGLICGYDQNKKTYKVYAYDKYWVYRAFDTSQKGLNIALKKEWEKGVYGSFFGIKAKSTQIDLNIDEIYKNLKEHLDSSFEKYPPHINKKAYGVIVYDYIAMYIDRLLYGVIPYERIDWRIFRQIWEHKKMMLELIKSVEKELKLDHRCSAKYEFLVKEADNMRMMYALHHQKRRDTVLPVLKKKTLKMKETEIDILSELILLIEGELYNAVELHL